MNRRLLALQWQGNSTSQPSIKWCQCPPTMSVLVRTVQPYLRSSSNSRTDRYSHQHFSQQSSQHHHHHRRHRPFDSGMEKSKVSVTTRSLRQFSIVTDRDVSVSHHPTAISSNTTQPATRQSNYGYRDLLRWTENILHPMRMPLGSVQPFLWQDIFVAMQVWLGYNPPSKIQQIMQRISSSNDQTKSVMIEATEPLIPRHVDLVDRLLTRLLYEHNAYRYNQSARTYRRRTYHEHDEQLQVWTTVLCQSWLTIANNFPDAPMAVQKASFWYDKMNDIVWSSHHEQETVVTVNDEVQIQQQKQKIPFMVALIQSYQRLVDASGMLSIRSNACQAAVDLLLDETTKQSIIPLCTNTPYSTLMKSCYQLALQQTLELAAAENAATNDINNDVSSSNVDFVSTASRIMEHMKILSEIPEWSDIGFQDGELDKIFDALFLDRMKDDVGDAGKTKKKLLSQFERETLQQRILTKINQAMTQKDQETVEEMVLYWRSHMQDDERDTLQWKPFAQAVTNFYLRMQDPVKATKWMQIQEQMPSQEAVQHAIQGTATRPSLVMSENDSDETNSSNFEELISLNRVFAENEQERVNQKLNLLNIWITKVRSPSVPWRATEILESLENEKGSDTILNAEIYTKVVKLWLHNSNDLTGITGQKALDIAMRCPVFDMTLLIIITNLMVQRQAAGEKTTPQSTFNIISLIREKFDDIPNDQIELIVSNSFQLLSGMPQSLEFLKFILDKGVDITSNILNLAVQSYSPNVALLLVLFDIDEETGLQPNSGFNKTAIQHLLSKSPLTSPVLERVARLLCDVTILMSKNNETINDILDLNFSTFKSVATLQYMPFAKRILLNLEKTIFTKDSPINSPIFDSVFVTKTAFLSPNSPLFAPDQEIQRNATLDEKAEGYSEIAIDTAPQQEKPPFVSKVSPIPLSFYKKLIILFGEKRNPIMIEFVYERLKEHRSNGYVELHPDKSCCSVYLKVAKEVDGLNTLDNRIDQLHELIGRYESSDRKDDHYTPQYLWFDILVGDLHERSKLIKVTQEQALNKKKVDPYEKDSRAAVKLLEKMHSLHITPKNLGRVYPFNAAMELVLQCRNQPMHYKVVTTLKQHMDDLGLVSNSYTMSLILKSCERAVASKNFAALTTMLQCLTDIRQMGKANPAVYLQCFKIFQLKRSLSDQEFVLAEKMMATVFKCCLEDGMLIDPVRYHFKALTLPMTYKRNYFELLVDGSEPPDWSRNVNKAE
jgi:hypothetical protein